MKLIRFGPPGRERPGLQLADGTRIDATGFGEDWGERFFETDGLSRLVALDRPHAAKAPRVRRRRAARPAAHAPEQDRVHRPQLRRPRARDERQDPGGARHLLQGHDGARRPERRPAAAARLGEDRLGGGARGRDRPARPLRLARGRARARGRLRAPQRLLGAPGPDRARRTVVEGQEPRRLRAARPVPRHAGRARRHAGAADVAHGQRREPPEEQHAPDDLRRRRRSSAT